MTDYIKREEVINLIDGMQQSFQISKTTQSNIDKRIAEMPSADVVEVVRCKDCRKREKVNGITVCPIAWIKAEVSDDDFCSLAERAEHE